MDTPSTVGIIRSIYHGFLDHLETGLHLHSNYFLAKRWYIIVLTRADFKASFSSTALCATGMESAMKNGYPQ